MKMIILPNLMPRLRIPGAIPPLPYASLAHDASLIKETSLPFKPEEKSHLVKL
jgi:hypothetical protein